MPRSTFSHSRLLALVAFSSWCAMGCGPEMHEPQTLEEHAPAEAVTAFSGTAIASVTVQNRATTTINLRGSNYNGYLSPLPATSIAPGGGNSFNHTGVGNILSGHFEYSSGSKACRFSYSSYPQYAGGPCTFNRSGTSIGSAYAECTASITSYNFQTCGMSVSLSMR
jgi:hypothetical protein